MNPKIFVTGQQIGLLGGPLYTSYKVLGAISHAERHQGEAVYWLETNDADFNEINHIDYLDKDGNFKTLRWDIPSGGFSTGYIPVDAYLIDILNRFFDDIHQTEHTKTLKEAVMDSYRLGRELGDASVALAKCIFGDFKLRFFNPADPEFRAYSKAILLREAERTPEGEQCNCFVLIDRKRVAVFRKGGRFVDRDEREMTLEEKVLLPNVKTRNLCQDGFFNAEAYIAGPGERRYIKELDGFYDFHGIKKARVIPRMSLLLIEPRIKRLLSKLDMSVADIDGNTLETLLKTRQAEESGFDMRGAKETLARITENYTNALAEAGFKEPAFHKLLQGEIKKLLGMRRSRIKEQFKTTENRIRTIYSHLKPEGMVQERVFNVFYYMNLYGGFAFMKQLYHRHPETDTTETGIFELKTE